jgi:hypothetical protein
VLPQEEEEVLRSLSDDAHREDAEEQSLQRKSGVQRMALRVLRSRILGIDTYNDSDDDSDDDSDNTTVSVDVAAGLTSPSPPHSPPHAQHSSSHILVHKQF